MLLNIEVPLGAAQRLARYILEEVVDALLGDSRLFGRTLLHLTKEFGHSDQNTLQLVVDFATLGHNIINHNTFCSSLIQSLLQHCKTLGIDSHRLIRQHVNTRINGRLDVCSLLAVVTCQNYHISLFLLNHLFEEIVARIEVFVPLCRILLTLVVDIYAVEMHLHIITLGSIDINFGRHLVVHIHLHQCSVKMTRVESHQRHLAFGAIETLFCFRLLGTTSHKQSYAHSNYKDYFSHIFNILRFSLQHTVARQGLCTHKDNIKKIFFEKNVC